MVFTSRDDLHVRSVPLFLRADQSFVHGDALKADLKRLDEYYDALPEETKKQSIYSFAAYPPNDDSYLVTQLWKKHLRPPEGYEQRPPQYEGKTLYVANAVPLGPETPVAMDEAAVVQFSKFVMRTKGKWIRVPEKSGD